ncbi:zeta toxin family protein [Nonomuraea sp. NPDC050310]|uniref:zeta toxin family protein n=1 Tax=Nonomuraea sp. NPDC050310 TaxID=3154935 RepID=UPI0033E4FB4F
MLQPSEFEEIALRFGAANFRVEAALVATPAALSRLGIVDRYWSEVQEVGHGRAIAPAVHDACQAGVLRGANAVDAGGLAHSAFVFRRSGHVVYANHVDASGTWMRTPHMAAAITAEWTRPWSLAEQQWFDSRLSTLRQSMPADWQAELQQIDGLAAPLAARSRTSAAARITSRHGGSPRPQRPRELPPAGHTVREPQVPRRGPR